MTDPEPAAGTKTTAELTVDGYVAQLILSSEDGLNPLDGPSHTLVWKALEDLRHHKGLRAAVIGATGKAFSAGGDFDLMLEVHDNLEQLLGLAEEGYGIVATMLETRFPLIAAVQGPAVGAGASIALTCDLVVACRGAFFSDPHVRMGIVADDGGCFIWPQSAGLHRARRFLLTGDRLSAEEAHQIGLVTDLVDTPEEVLPAAVALAERIAALPPLGVQGTKRVLNNSTRMRAAEVLELGIALAMTSLRADDLVEAVTAARERRTGTYKGF